MEQPLISIIIPTYNRAHLIGETLDSVLAQTYTNWECIVVDDGSSDDTANLMAAYCEKDTRFQYHHRPIDSPKGANACRNYGFKVSKGVYLNWFDDDDVMLPMRFEKQLFSMVDEIDMSVCRLYHYDFDKNQVLRENVIFSKKIIEDYLVGKIAFYICGCVWKRSFITKQVKLFDETISNLDDWDFNLRMLYQDPSIVYINEPLIKYRIHETSLSKEISKLNIKEIKSEIKARDKHITLLKLNKKENPLILKYFIQERFKYFFRVSMVQNHPSRFYFFKHLLMSQIVLLDFIGTIKSILAFVIYSTFHKGYRMLK